MFPLMRFYISGVRFAWRTPTKETFMLNVHGKKRRVPIRPNATAGPLSRRFQPQMRLRYKKSDPAGAFRHTRATDS